MNEVELERLVVRLTGDASSYQKMLIDISVSTKQTAQQVQQATNQISGSGGFGFGLRRFALQAMGALTPLLGVFGILGGAFKGVQLAAQAEQAAVTFEVLLKSADAAKKRIEELTKFAAETPFELPEVVRASKLLQTFGGSTIATGRALTMVGDMASAAGARFDEVAMWVGRAYSAIQSGRPFGEAAMRLQELGLISGQERNSMEDLQKQGKSAADQWKNFEKVMSKFTGTMLKQSQTLSGLFSTMSDDINAGLRTIGENIVEVLHLKEVMQAISAAAQAATEWLKGMSPEMRSLIAVTVALVTAAAALALIWPLVASVGAAAFGMLVGIIDVLLGPINAIGIAVVAIGAMWVASVGGMENALTILKNTAMSLWGWIKTNFTTIAIVVGVMSGPIGWVALAIAAVIKNSGGLNAVWEKLKSAGGGVWAWISGKIQAFVGWATPKLNALMVNINAGWRIFRAVVGVAWDWVKARIAGFVAWATPYVQAYFTMVARNWEKIGTAAGIAWDWIKTKVMAFVDWIRPIALAYAGYLSAAWDLAMYAAEKAWDFTVDVAVKAWDFITDAASGFGKFIADLWRSIVGDTNTDWKSVQDFIVDALIAAEFGLRNFGAVAAHVWTGIKIGFYSFTGEIEHFFRSTLPALLSWFGRNWSQVFADAFNFTITTNMNMGRNIVSVIRNLPGLIAGTTSFADIWRPLAQGFESTITELPRISARQASAIETELLAQFERQGAALQQSFQEFRRRRLAEIAAFRFGIPADQMEAAMNAAARQAEQGGAQIGQALTNGAKNEMKHADAVLRSSAEAITRIQEYMDRRNEEAGRTGATRGFGRGGGRSGSDSGAIRFNLVPIQATPVPINAGAPLAGEQLNRDTVVNMRDLLAQLVEIARQDQRNNRNTVQIATID